LSGITLIEPVLRDILAPNLRVVFCGINPGLTSAVHGHHFVNRSNRFWRTIYLAGFTSELITPENDQSVLKHGIGLTTAVARPTKSAGELLRHDFQGAAKTLSAKISRYSPRSIAFLGKPAYAAIVDRRLIHWGKQQLRFAECETWVLPNPSGLNRSFKLEDLVRAYTDLRVALDHGQELTA
jgi:TDG/mug DNA glycosylase family protein